jgi:hypothetical protein
MADHVAIFCERIGDFKWYRRPVTQEHREPEPLPPGCVEIVYKATGRHVKREDGKQAEIFEPEETVDTTVDAAYTCSARQSSRNRTAYEYGTIDNQRSR